MNIDPKVKEILSKYHDDPQSAVWKHAQSGQWIARHKDLEIVAARAGIKFDLPVIVDANTENKCAALVVSGSLNEKSEWSVGEAAPYNNKMGYPWAMAEKRAKDRVILKLIGLHGTVYSDIEADDFKEKDPKNSATEGLHSNETAETIYDNMLRAIKKATKESVDEMLKNDVWVEWVKYLEKNAPDLLAEARVKYTERKQELKG